ncbi:MAG TPA: S16 family serine protease, partial [Ktedonobacterales bacterium]|nr:S16 family serine protease [Ktedonobacterales bacterium]
ILQDRERVPTTGAAVGQITGLSVLNYTPHEARFGTPFRVSVTVSPGQERLIDIERESRAADETHIAGALTMAGFLAWRYGRQRAINVVARTRFEQLDNETVGPSASAAELLALLSALAEAPVRAALAVTGAVSQQGEMQLVGGINAKIEGFWEICHARQAQGEAPAGGYGILIPAANAGDIMLRADIADDIASGGWFHIWPVATVDEALPLLTGLGASAIHARVARTLRRFTELVERQGTP